MIENIQTEINEMEQRLQELKGQGKIVDEAPDASVLREPPPLPPSIPDVQPHHPVVVGPSAPDVADISVQWAHRNDNGVWENFSADNQRLLEDNFQTRTRHVNNLVDSHRNYYCDLKKGVVGSWDTGETMKIRRGSATADYAEAYSGILV